MLNRICRVCGLPTAECNPVTNHLVGGLTINRINREELNTMSNRQFAVSKERVYLNKDKTKAVYEGDPEAATLLVGKGCEIEQSVAEAYGIATEEATGFAVVTPSTEEAYNKAKKVGQTNPEQTLREEINKNIDPKSLSFGAGVSQQASLMAQGVINAKKTALDTTPGVLNEGLEVTHNLQADELKAKQADGGAETQTGQALDQPAMSRTKEIGAERTGLAEKQTENEPQGNETDNPDNPQGGNPDNPQGGNPDNATSELLNELTEEQNRENN